MVTNNRTSARLAAPKGWESVETAVERTKVQNAIERAKAPRNAQNRLRNICNILSGHDLGDAEFKIQDALDREAQKRAEELALEIHTDMQSAREAANRLVR